MTELVVEPHRLDFVDVVTSSHNHTDHLDAETLGPLMDVNPELAVVVPAANQAFAADRLNVSLDRLRTIDDGTANFTTGCSPQSEPAIEFPSKPYCFGCSVAAWGFARSLGITGSSPRTAPPGASAASVPAFGS